MKAARDLQMGKRVRTACFGLLLMSCVGGSKPTSDTDKQRLQAYVLPGPPADMPHSLGINFDDRVELLGYKLEPAGQVKPGQKVTLTMYWKALKKVEAGWNLFTHVLDGAGERVLNIDNVGPIREWRDTGQVLGPSNWQVGKVYVDEQAFNVPTGLKSNRLRIVAGVWKDDNRLPIVKGPHDRENRGTVTTLQTGPDGAPSVVTRVPMMRVDKLAKDAKISIDGKLEETAWKVAPTTGPLVDVATGRRNTAFPVNAIVKVLWDDQGLYVGFDVRDDNVVGGFDAKAQDPHLWTKDTIEIMIDPDGDGDNKDYYEIQISPQNLVFDSQFDDYNAPKQDPEGPFGHQDWTAKLKSAVTIRGTLDKPGDEDEGYTVEAMLPWKSFSKAKRTPPAPGDTWRINFYAMQNNSGVSWSPILGQGNFHKASRFGRVLFAEKGWMPSAPPASTTAARRLPGLGGSLPHNPKIKLPAPPRE